MWSFIWTCEQKYKHEFEGLDLVALFDQHCLWISIYRNRINLFSWRTFFFNCVCFTKKGGKYGLRGSSCVTSREKKIRSAERILSSTKLCCCLVEETLLLLQPLLLIDIHSLIGKKFSQFLLRKTTSNLARHFYKKNWQTNQPIKFIVLSYQSFLGLE